MKRTTTFAIFTFLSLLLISCTAFASRKPINVAASIFPLADIVRQVGGNRVNVTTLLPAGASPHTFAPSVSTMRGIAETRLYVRVGAGLDTWGDKLLSAAKQPPLVVTATDGVPLMGIAEQELIRDGEEHHHEAGNPHIWLDPIIVRDHIVPQIINALSALSPRDSDYFKANGSRFAAGLTALDRDFRATVRTLSKRDFIAIHGAWPYLARRYGLRQIAAVEPFPGKEPSAKYIAALIRMARKSGVTTIFAESQLSGKAARVIAAELRGHVLVLDPIGGESIPDRNSYLALIRYDLSIIARGMK
jgi:zinc transport system substrate-binding protein